MLEVLAVIRAPAIDANSRVFFAPAGFGQTLPSRIESSGESEFNHSQFLSDQHAAPSARSCADRYLRQSVRCERGDSPA